MATNFQEKDASGKASPLPLQAETKQEDGGIAFHFKLPASGLALRSVAIVDGVAELRFDASPKVPTITEEDIATAFRLAVEGKRPEFFFILIPPWHPFFGRQFKRYSPAWLRGTSVGELLAEADWNMKCLHVGAQSNETKSTFWSWQKKSHLDGLATRLDFPEDNPSGSVMMSCKSATVQKSENEMIFSEEPKMTIVDDSSSLYTKYITEIYPSVAYHDEPLFLKMQELIKLILAAEWFIEKGVSIDKEWMMEQTSKSSQQVNVTAIEGSEHTSNHSKEPPRALIPPQPTEIKCPTTDVIVKTREAELQQSLAKKGFKKWYGWIDEGGKEMIVFDEDGVQCEQQRSLKVVINQQMDVAGQPGLGQVTGWSSCPLPSPDPTPTSTPASGKFVRQLSLPQNSHQEIISRLGRMSIDIKVDENTSDEDTGEVKITKTLQLSPTDPAMAPLALKQTTTLKSSVDDYDKLYGHMDPNGPIWPEIPGESEAIIPNVQSWTELFRETVPWPHVLQGPHNDIREYVAESGGVSTRTEFPTVKTEPLRPREVKNEKPWVDQYMERDNMLVVQGQRKKIQGQIRRATSQEFAQISSNFSRDWDMKKGACPNVDYVFVVTNSTLLNKWNLYKQRLRDQTVEPYYHGTSVTCNIVSTGRLCPYQSCGICGISSDGLKRDFIRKNIPFQRFGHGFYLAPNSSKCHDYTKGAYNYRAMLLCDVCPGRKYVLQSNSQQMQGPPHGFDSIYGVGGQLNYPEIVIHNPDAVMPRYIIMYKKDGVRHPLAN